MNDFGGFTKREDPIHALRDAMDELTLPVLPWHKDGEVVKDSAQPLLEHLRLAVTNSLGAGGGAGKLAHERTPMDVSAFTLYESIDGRIRAWCLDAKITAREGLADSLRAWFVVWSQKTREDLDVKRHTTVIETWVESITDLLEPPWRQEITKPCPACGQMWAMTGDKESQESTRAVWALWRPDAEKSYAICYACERVWKGVPQMKALNTWQDEIIRETERKEAAS